MFRRLVFCLVRWNLGLKKFQHFRFKNQKSNAVYYFTSTHLYKVENGEKTRSGVSLNWITDDACKVNVVT